MKNKGMLLSILLLIASPLFASPSWIGVQGIRWQSEQTATATYMGSSSTTSESEEGVGLIISGSLYPEMEYPYGLGFQFGARRKGTSANSDAPLAWRGVLTTQYGAGISDSLFMEFGTGLLYERLTDTYTSGGIEKQLTIKSYSLYSSTSLVLNLTGYISLVGGVAMSYPLFAKAEVTSAGVTTKPEMHVTGFSFEALIGIAVNL